MSYPVKNGQTSVVLRFKLLDTSKTDGSGLTGLTNASSGLIISTIADNEASAVAYTVAGSTIETIATLGTYAAPTATKCRFKEVDSTNHKGVYEFQFADARFAVANAKSLLISVSGATNLAQADYVLALTSDDPYVAKPANFAALGISAGGNVAISSNIKKNVALNAFAFTMTDSTNHNPKTGLAVAAQRSLDGGAFAACANAVTELSNGNYNINLAASDLNANTVMLRFTATGADDLNVEIVTDP